MNGDVIKLRVRVGDDQIVDVRGRDAWALSNLIAAGEAGCTPIRNPAPRWSHYVFKLRRAGIGVVTITEKHGGSYAGDHAKYVLSTPVEVLTREVRP